MAVDRPLPSSLLGLSDAVLLAIFERCSAAGSIASLAGCSKRLNLLARVCARRLHMQGGHGMEVYKAAIGHAAQQMPHLTSVDCQLARPQPPALSDAAVPDFIVRLKQLPSLRQLSITSSASYTAISMLALGELRGLTALTLAVADGDAADAAADGSSSAALLSADLEPLARLTNLQQLHIKGWQPFGLQQQEEQLDDLGAALVQPAAPGTCCLPVGSLSNVQFSNVQEHSVHGWLPHLLACSRLQQLQLVQLDSAIFGDEGSSIYAALDAVVYHNTQPTSLRVAVDDGDENWDWQPPAHISRLQRLQQLHYKSSSRSKPVSALEVTNSSSGMFKCTALRELEYIHTAAGVAGFTFPHLTRLKLFVKWRELPWPTTACPGLLSLTLVVRGSISPVLAAIPCVQQLTELQFDSAWSPWNPAAPENVAAIRDLAGRAGNLRALHLVVPHGGWADDDDELLDSTPCLQAVASFTQLHKLHLTLKRPEDADKEVAVCADDVLRAVGQLLQLQQLVLEGSAVCVNPCFVVGLELRLPQLSVLRCVGCSGMDGDDEIERVRRGLREGLQLVWE